jgi:hypothetical protein
MRLTDLYIAYFIVLGALAVIVTKAVTFYTRGLNL